MPLLQRVAASFPEHCAPRLLIAPVGRYILPGWQTMPDLRAGEGPLAGLETALTALSQQVPAGGWLAFAATDLPNLSAAFWNLLLEAVSDEAQAVIGLDGLARPQPLAALYHTQALSDVQQVLDSGERRMSALLERLWSVQVPWNEIEAASGNPFVNLNTLPE